MSDYTPTTGEVRRRYAYARSDKPIHKNRRAVAEFDRWLAEHDRQVAERAWDEGYLTGLDRERHLLDVLAPPHVLPRPRGLRIMTTDLDALIAEARGVAPFYDDMPDLIRRLADALESTLAELRQERERADGFEEQCSNQAHNLHAAQNALSRAEETIEKAARLIERNEPWVAHTALTRYYKQKEN